MGAEGGARGGHPRRPAARPDHRLRILLAAALAWAAAAAAAPAAPRVLSLDQCADQYVLGLSPRTSIVGLSKRADDADSRLRHLAAGLPLRRASLEAVVAARPQVVVRHWGGDARLVSALERQGVAVVTLEEATDFAGVRRNIRTVSARLDRAARGEALIAEMDARLAASAGAWRGAPALYVTPGGFTAGPGSLVDAILRAAGLRNLVKVPTYQPLSLERLVLDPPRAVVLGFFDAFMLANNHWGLGGHQVLRRTVEARQVASLPGAMLGCPDWFAAEAAELLASRAR